MMAFCLRYLILKVMLNSIIILCRRALDINKNDNVFKSSNQDNHSYSDINQSYYFPRLLVTYRKPKILITAMNL